MTEYFSPGVYIEEIETGTKPIEGVSTSIAAFIGQAVKGPVMQPVLISSWKQFETVFGSFQEGFHLGYAVDLFFKNGGQKLYIVRIPADDNCCYNEALYILEDIEDISLVAIPGKAGEIIYRELIRHCEKMKYRFAILDPGFNLPVTASGSIKEQKNRWVNSPQGYAALYYPWLQINDQISGKSMFIPPSGAIAGIYAKSDLQRGVHKAPANENILGITGLERKLNLTEQGDLNPDGINVLRAFPGRGYLVWGARTVAPDSIYKYINIRRLLIYLEKSIESGIQWAIFEPNNAKLWSKVKLSTTEFLTKVWRDGALMGIKPEQAFYVKCDRTTMTQNDIDSGRLIMEIGIALTKPAEFIIFRIALYKKGLEE